MRGYRVYRLIWVRSIEEFRNQSSFKCAQDGNLFKGFPSFFLGMQPFMKNESPV